MISNTISLEHFKCKLDNPSLPVICEEIARILLEQKQWDIPEATGLYLLSPDAGARAAVAFWQSALEVGPGLVSPGSFPWTLANGPASCLARLLTIKGPNYTLVGDEKEWSLLEHLAENDLREGRIENAVLLYLEADEQEGFWQQL